jgi:putative transcriptional regulator
MKKPKRSRHLSEAEFADLRTGAEEARSHMKGEKITLKTSKFRQRQQSSLSPRRIRSIRARLNVSQPVFAELLYVARDTAAKWEQGVRKPSGSALRLLELIEKQPEILMES